LEDYEKSLHNYEGFEPQFADLLLQK